MHPLEKTKNYGSITDSNATTILQTSNKNNYVIHYRSYIIASLTFALFSILVLGEIFINRQKTLDNKPLHFTEKIVGSKVKPNFVIIVADDLGWNSLGYTEDTMAFATPYLTALAESGINMENFYAQEVCSPSRGSLLTGRYPLSIGMQYGMVSANAEWGMPLDETTLAEVLQDTGYSTHMLGKWHLGYFSPKFLPTERGCDSWTGNANGENY